MFVCANKIFTNCYSISLKLGKVMPYYVHDLQKLRVAVSIRIHHVNFTVTLNIRLDYKEFRKMIAEQYLAKLLRGM